MTNAPQWMPLYIADYMADTGHLSTTEHGAYLLLIMHYWKMGSLPDDDRKLAKLTRCSDRQWTAIRATIADFFEEGWRHPRIEREREAAIERVSKRVESGSRGGKAKSLKNNNSALANATALPEQTDSNSPTQSQDTLHRDEEEESARARPISSYQVLEPERVAVAELQKIVNRITDEAIPDGHVLRTDVLATSTVLGWIRSGFDIERDAIPAVRLAIERGERRIMAWRGLTQWVQNYRDDRMKAEKARPPPPLSLANTIDETGKPVTGTFQTLQRGRHDRRSIIDIADDIISGGPSGVASATGY